MFFLLRVGSTYLDWMFSWNLWQYIFLHFTFYWVKMTEKIQREFLFSFFHYSLLFSNFITAFLSFFIRWQSQPKYFYSLLMSKNWKKKFTKTVEHNETEAQLNCNAVLSEPLFSLCVDIKAVEKWTEYEATIWEYRERKIFL